MTTNEDIKRWYNAAKEQNAKFLIIMCDTFDFDDYPVYCMTDEECKKHLQRPGSLQTIMEIYDLNIDIETQINEVRCFNPPK